MEHANTAWESTSASSCVTSRSELGQQIDNEWKLHKVVMPADTPGTNALIDGSNDKIQLAALNTSLIFKTLYN